MLSPLRFIFALVAALSSLGGPALAGPWPREPGTFFTSTTSTLTAPGFLPSRSEYYVEYGLRPRLTLGAAMEMRGTIRTVDAFVRWHPPDMSNGLAWGLTSGVRYAPYSWAPGWVFVGWDVGQGFDTDIGNIWLRSGGRVYAGVSAWTGMEYVLDTGTQIGWRRGRWIAMMGLTHYLDRLNALTRLRPAVGVSFGDHTFVAEVVIPPTGRIESVRVSFWSEF